MMDRIRKLAERIDALSLRERGLLLFALVFVLYSLWSSMLMTPLATRHKQLQAQLKQLRTDTDALAEQSALIGKNRAQDPDAETRANLVKVQAEIAALDEHIRNRTQGLIDSTDMAQVLEDVLKDAPGLKLIGLQSQAARPLLDSVAEDAGSPAQHYRNLPGIYRHGMVLEFEGGYLEALRYLRSVEALPWRLYWDSVEFKVLTFPAARFTITVHTIGLREGWIGV